jgi:hypothetical protein
MADRVSATIAIGGTVSAAQFARLVELIALYDLRVDWDGDVFTPDQLPTGDALRLCAYEVAWGNFEELEQYCCNEQIVYQRWSGACSGSFGAERIVYDGKTGPLNFAVDDDDNVLVDAQAIDQLGSMRAIRRYIAQAEIVIPPFAIAPDSSPP